MLMKWFGFESQRQSLGATWCKGSTLKSLNSLNPYVKKFGGGVDSSYFN
jgi:hypothetical protein